MASEWPCLSVETDIANAFTAIDGDVEFTLQPRSQVARYSSLISNDIHATDEDYPQFALFHVNTTTPQTSKEHQFQVQVVHMAIWLIRDKVRTYPMSLQSPELWTRWGKYSASIGSRVLFSQPVKLSDSRVVCPLSITLVATPLNWFQV